MSKEGSREESSHWGTLGNVNRCWRNVMWMKNSVKEREIRELPPLMRNSRLDWCWRSPAENALLDQKRISRWDVWEVTSGLQISNPSQREQNYYINPGLATQTTNEVFNPLRRSGVRWLANECCFCNLLMWSKTLLSTPLHETIFRWKPLNIACKYLNILIHKLLFKRFRVCSHLVVRFSWIFWSRPRKKIIHLVLVRLEFTL